MPMGMAVFPNLFVFPPMNVFQILGHFYRLADQHVLLRRNSSLYGFRFFFFFQARHMAMFVVG